MSCSAHGRLRSGITADTAAGPICAIVHPERLSACGPQVLTTPRQ
jgi:hypothetical protein